MPAIHDQIDNLPIAEDTKKVLYELIKRKIKVDRLYMLRIVLAVLNGVIALLILAWLNRLSAISSRVTLDTIGYLGESPAAVFFIVTAITAFFISGAVAREYKKQKQKYDDLREETIVRMDTKWDISEESRLKDKISRMLDEYRKINIRHSK
ncbi:DUF2663 family protein [Paenibacillus humicola]|uniref:DUF2663 family protein n=1 Tax=Paenibacillus humicola TaxID=3110540 RepID=UPI00237AF104|nr:DUF2663 family protein [Paenibacillus humicola]